MSYQDQKGHEEDRWYSDQGSEISGSEEDLYERQMVEEARMIVAGTTMMLASREHLRILLSCLDTSGSGDSESYETAPF